MMRSSQAVAWMMGGGPVFQKLQSLLFLSHLTPTHPLVSAQTINLLRVSALEVGVGGAKTGSRQLLLKPGWVQELPVERVKMPVPGPQAPGPIPGASD